MTAKTVIEKTPSLESQSARRQKAIDAVLSAVQAAEVHGVPGVGMELSTLRAIKMGRPYKVKASGLTERGFSGFTIMDDIAVEIGRDLFEAKFPKAAIQQVLAFIQKLSFEECEQFSAPLFVFLSSSGEVFLTPGISPALSDPAVAELFMSSNQPVKLISVNLCAAYVLERRQAFLEHRDYQEPAVITKAKATTESVEKELLQAMRKAIAGWPKSKLEKSMGL